VTTITERGLGESRRNAGSSPQCGLRMAGCGDMPCLLSTVLLARTPTCHVWWVVRSRHRDVGESIQENFFFSQNMIQYCTKDLNMFGHSRPDHYTIIHLIYVHMSGVLCRNQLALSDSLHNGGSIHQSMHLPFSSLKEHYIFSTK
jgi:hypothetical protein